MRLKYHALTDVRFMLVPFKMHERELKISRCKCMGSKNRWARIDSVAMVIIILPQSSLIIDV